MDTSYHKYQFDKAKNNLADAKRLFNSGDYNRCYELLKFSRVLLLKLVPYLYTVNANLAFEVDILEISRSNLKESYANMKRLVDRLEDCVFD